MASTPPLPLKFFIRLAPILCYLLPNRSYSWPTLVFDDQNSPHSFHLPFSPNPKLHVHLNDLIIASVHRRLNVTHTLDLKGDYQKYCDSYFKQPQSFFFTQHFNTISKQRHFSHIYFFKVLSFLRLSHVGGSNASPSGRLQSKDGQEGKQGLWVVHGRVFWQGFLRLQRVRQVAPFSFFARLRFFSLLQPRHLTKVILSLHADVLQVGEPI
jgi:hypothetical protein